MYDFKKYINKMCSFYVSDIHLATMLLPYISKKINDKKNIETLLQKDIKKDVNMLISNLNINEQTQKNILNINWNKNNINSYIDLKKIIENAIKKNIESYFVIIGKESYINSMNDNIEKWISLNPLKINSKINIINCYEVMDFNENMNEILDKHNKIINTSGEKEIEEIFEGYKKELKI